MGPQIGSWIRFWKIPTDVLFFYFFSEKKNVKILEFIRYHIPILNRDVFSTSDWFLHAKNYLKWWDWEEPPFPHFPSFKKKSVPNPSNFHRREASIKQEGIVGAEEEEAISLEHYAMLEVVDSLPISIDLLIICWTTDQRHKRVFTSCSRMPSACMTPRAMVSWPRMTLEGE